jgi:hypothetical protein
MQNSRDVQILRELVKQYAERAALPVMEERRRLVYQGKADVRAGGVNRFRPALARS